MTHPLRLRLILAVAAAWLPGSIAMAEELPVPPVPPAATSSLSAAPVPDADMRDPFGSTAPAPKVALRFYRNETYNGGYGYMPGSRYQSAEDKKPIQTPGFSVSVPIK